MNDSKLQDSATNSKPVTPKVENTTPPLPKNPQKPQSKRRWGKTILFTSVVGGIVVAGAYHEMENSTWQAHFIAPLAKQMTYQVQKGAAPSGEIRFPAYGPFDVRMGYVALPSFISQLQSRNYAIDSQARWSTSLQQTSTWGLFPPYLEKSRAGLMLYGRNNAMLYDSRYPRQHYASFEQIAPLIVNTLLFIENRELLDKQHPQRNPAIEWARIARVTGDLVINRLTFDDEKLAGGSTLATQIEKYRHSPDGLTNTPADKLRQMGSATLRAYRNGPETFEARKNIAREYINTVPLAARGRHGEVNGIADGLRIWYGADVVKVDALLREALPSDPVKLREQATAYKQVLSLFLAQRRPSFYLGSGDPKKLNDLTNIYLKLLTQDKILNAKFSKLAQTIPLRFAPIQVANSGYSFDKAVNVSRTRLTTMLGLKNLYELDRIDLTAQTTFDLELQKIATKTLKKLADPEQAKAAGLFGDKLLNEGNDLGKIVYSFTLVERTPTANLVRVQADNFEQPLDINEGVKLDLGSTAKLRTLISYLNIIKELHDQYGAMSPEELAKVKITENNNLENWAVSYLRTTSDHTLPAMLSAAMDRTYSASTEERFFTGGGSHTFANFDAADNSKTVTMREAIRKSINLPFIRLMRDIVKYHITRLPGSSADLLENINDERRQVYLEKFAEREGSTFVRHFYSKYKGKTPDEVFDLLLNSARLTIPRLILIYKKVSTKPNVDDFIKLFQKRFPGNSAAVEEIKKRYDDYDIDKYNLADQGYLAGIHPLELWTAAAFIKNSATTQTQLLADSLDERREVYSWLYKTKHKSAQDVRIRQLLELEGFEQIHKEWKKLGYPFESLVPSYATSIGSSADRPAALAELMGILINNGVRLPTVRIENIRFAAQTPFETFMKRKTEAPEQVLNADVAAEIRTALRDVVENGTAKRLKQPFTDIQGNVMTVGGKTGTGDHRYDLYGAGGRLIQSIVVNRTATFVFFIGDRYYGTLTAFVHGPEAAKYRFTSGLPVQILKTMSTELAPYLSGEKVVKYFN